VAPIDAVRLRLFRPVLNEVATSGTRPRHRAAIYISQRGAVGPLLVEAAVGLQRQVSQVRGRLPEPANASRQ